MRTATPLNLDVAYMTTQLFKSANPTFRMDATMPWEPLPKERDLFCEVYIDESSQNDRFMVLGALVVPYSHVNLFEEYLVDIRKDTNVKPLSDDGTLREMKWSLVSKSNLEAYKKFVTAVFDFRIRYRLSSLKDVGTS